MYSIPDISELRGRILDLNSALESYEIDLSPEKKLVDSISSEWRKWSKSVEKWMIRDVYR